MQKRKVGDELEARILLAKVAKAGGDLRTFARTHGIDGRSLNAWRQNLARRGRPSRSRKPARPVGRRGERTPGKVGE